MTRRTKTILGAGLACLAAVGVAVALTTCGRQPTGNATTFAHDTVAGQACSQCHEGIRPAAYLNYPHGNSQDCAVCHLPKDAPAGPADSPDPTLWLPRREYDHSVNPPACMPCHDTERPTAASHPGPNPEDCVTCHQGDWNKNAFIGKLP